MQAYILYVYKYVDPYLSIVYDAVIPWQYRCHLGINKSPKECYAHSHIKLCFYIFIEYLVSAYIST